MRHNRFWREAWKFFWPEGNGKAKPGYVLHHRDHTLKMTDPVRYHEWWPLDLEMMLSAEHTRLHKQGTKASNEAKKKMSVLHSGKKWWSNGIEQRRCDKCPGEGWKAGRGNFRKSAGNV